PAIRRMSEAQGRLTLPARGEIVQEFGQSGDYGAASKGVTIRARPGAEVVAPYDGQVVFAGPFRGYGPILIIEHTEGYHTLLAGLSRIDAAPGQWVLAGEPVGVMGEQRDGDGPALYVELRRNGRPIDPLPWLALHSGKVSG
ncbi:MAG TPA: peptidoglycan DD-metalloendopeptidase family protein, partial [Steroidobacteraceae bacterium]|nr:peptidoglycan DD-metalloendopeptidase family protein [Steroidobacteraceae bacterium]